MYRDSKEQYNADCLATSDLAIQVQLPFRTDILRMWATSDPRPQCKEV